MRKRIQFKLNNRVFAVEIETDNTILNEEDIATAHNELAEQINKNNEKIEIIFFEELMLMYIDEKITINDATANILNWI